LEVEKKENHVDKTTGLILRTLGPFNVFIPLNGWICLHGVLDLAGCKSVFECT